MKALKNIGVIFLGTLMFAGFFEFDDYLYDNHYNIYDTGWYNILSMGMFVIMVYLIVLGFRYVSQNERHY